MTREFASELPMIELAELLVENVSTYEDKEPSEIVDGLDRYDTLEELQSEGVFQDEDEIDLFQDYVDNPKCVSDEMAELLNHYEEIEVNGRNIRTFLEKTEKLGYTFDYGLSCEPFNLRKL